MTSIAKLIARLQSNLKINLIYNKKSIEFLKNLDNAINSLWVKNFNSKSCNMRSCFVENLRNGPKRKKIKKN